MSRLGELSDNIDRRVAQLNALLIAANSNSDVLGELSQVLRSNYFWVCSDLVAQLQQDLDAYRGLLKVTHGGEA